MNGRTIYIAPKPTLTMNWFQRWMSSLLGGRIGSLIISAQNDPDLRNEAADRYNQFIDNKQSTISANRFTIQTHDGALLDTVEVKMNEDQDNSQHPYIIFLGGVGSCYERNLNLMVTLAETTNAVCIGFNPRGVCESTGAAYSKHDSLTDGIAQVQRLIDNGVNPGWIILKGESYGSAVAAEVGEYFHNKGLNIYVFCGRAFSSLSEEVSGLVSRGINKAVSTVAKPFIKGILYSTNWDANTYKSFKNLPEQNREYMLVRSPRETRAWRKDDLVVGYTESLHYALRRDQKMQNVNSRSIDDSDMTAEKQKSRARKFMTEAPGTNGHIVPLARLTNRNNEDGLSFFRQFVVRSNQAIVTEPASILNSDAVPASSRQATGYGTFSFSMILAAAAAAADPVDSVLAVSSSSSSSSRAQRLIP